MSQFNYITHRHPIIGIGVGKREEEQENNLLYLLYPKNQIECILDKKFDWKSKIVNDDFLDNFFFSLNTKDNLIPLSRKTLTKPIKVGNSLISQDKLLNNILIMCESYFTDNFTIRNFSECVNLFRTKFEVSEGIEDEYIAEFIRNLKIFLEIRDIRQGLDKTYLNITQILRIIVTKENKTERIEYIGHLLNAIEAYSAQLKRINAKFEEFLESHKENFNILIDQFRIIFQITTEKDSYDKGTPLKDPLVELEQIDLKIV